MTGAPFALVNYELWPTTTVAQSAAAAEAAAVASLLVSLYGVGATSITSMSTTPTQTATTPPTSTKSQAPVTPSATCTAVANLVDTQVAIWTNYITDGGYALENAETQDCPGLASWTVTNVVTAFTGADGVTWFSNQLFQFTLQVTHPAALNCVVRAIIAAGGAASTSNCPFTPAIQPPKARNVEEFVDFDGESWLLY